MIEQKQQWVLVLGGTNFMGKALLDALRKTSYRVCCINRGKIYWNNEAREENQHLEWFCSDRKDHQDYQATLKFASQHLKITAQNKWKAVIDFCAFKWRDVQSVVHSLSGLTEKYFFISTDSVYNNFSQPPKTPIQESNFDLETEYERLKSTNKKHLDSYGYNKLKCELYLQRKKTLPFVCLRLPDVIGPFDNTDRFWTTIEWMKNSQKYPMPLSAADQNKPISLVDCLSLTSFIVSLIGRNNIPSDTYNLCFKQSFTIFQFLQTIRKELGIQVAYKAIKEKSSDQLYPSVECGSISCQKAIQELGWNPLSLKEAVNQTVNFFVQKAGNYKDEKATMERYFKRKVLNKSQ